MPMDESNIKEVLKAVKFPGFSRDIVSFGIIKGIAINGHTVSLSLLLPSRNEHTAQAIEEGIKKALLSLPDIAEVRVDIGYRDGTPRMMAPENPWADQVSIPGVKNIIAVASGKGGVGKSTVAVNLAVALARQGLKIGLMDADTYGPSLPRMLGAHKRPMINEQRKIIPVEAHGVKFISIGSFIDDSTAMIWRGPMVMKMVEQFLRDVDWGDLDLLLVDLPPGTGDAQLTLAQKVPLSGAIIVTTPQDMAFTVARRGLMMFRDINVPVLGIIENMSYFHCPHCGERTDIFSHGGGKTTSQDLEVPFLAEIPLDPEIREGGDTGRPIVVTSPNSPAAQSFTSAAQTVLGMLEFGKTDRKYHVGTSH